MLSDFELIAVLLVLTASFGWINHRFLGLPDTVGLLAMGLAASLVLLLVEISFPETPLYQEIADFVRQVDFRTAVLDGVLAFLLFAGALHVNIGALRDRAWVVGGMATVGVLLSTALVGFGFYYISALLAAERRRCPGY